MTKKELRKYVKDKHINLTEEYYKNQEQIILQKIKENKHFIRAKKIGIYYPLKNELNLLTLIEEYPDKVFYFPKTIKKDLSFKHVKNLAELVDGPFGLKEPKEDLPTEPNLDLYLVPCVATNKKYRIGHGAGFYDYYFKNHRGYKIGVVLEVFKDLYAPIDNYDIPMDEII